MSLNHILLLIIVAGLFVVMMYMFVRVLFLPNAAADEGTQKPKKRGARAAAMRKR